MNKFTFYCLKDEVTEFHLMLEENLLQIEKATCTRYEGNFQIYAQNFIIAFYAWQFRSSASVMISINNVMLFIPEAIRSSMCV